jgi:adenylate kinase family enzyme
LIAEYLEEMLARTVIIGNSGSGKSHLAESLSMIYSAPVVHLDQLFWMPGGFNEQRPKDEIRNTVELKRKEDAWIVEGVFGELAELFLPQAQSLIFLDMDWTVCDAGLLVRGSESSKQLEAAKAEENFKKLLLWAEQYWARTNSCSRSGHLQLFSNFVGQKFKLTRRAEVADFLKQPKMN